MAECIGDGRSRAAISDDGALKIPDVMIMNLTTTHYNHI